MFPPSLLPVQRVGGGLRHPRGGPPSLVCQTGLKLSVSRSSPMFYFFLFLFPKVFPPPPPALARPNVFFFLNIVFFLRSVLTSRSCIQSSRWASHFSCFRPAQTNNYLLSTNPMKRHMLQFKVFLWDLLNFKKTNSFHVNSVSSCQGLKKKKKFLKLSFQLSVLFYKCYYINSTLQDPPARLKIL